MSEKPDKLQSLDEAALNLLDGETVELFRRALEQELAAFYRTGGVDSWRFYQVGLFGDSVLVQVHDEDGGSHHEQVAFRREGDSIVVGPAAVVRITMGAVPVQGDAEGVGEARLPEGGRRRFGAAAYAAPFFEADGGSYGRGGVLDRARSRLPHHVEIATDPHDHASVDVQLLRNSLARFGSARFDGFPASEEARARTHLERHVDALVAARHEARDALIQDLVEFRGGHYRAIRERLERDGLWLDEAAYLGIACHAR